MAYFCVGAGSGTGAGIRINGPAEPDTKEIFYGFATLLRRGLNRNVEHSKKVGKKKKT
jgi:hypothetical protein